MSTKSITIYILGLFLFIGVHYLEGLSSVGNFSFAQLWKIPLLIYFIYCCYRYDRKWYTFEKTSFLLSFENFFCPAIITNPFSIVIHASKQLPLVLCFNFWMSLFKNKKDLMENILYSIAQYICITSLIVLLGLIKPIRGFASAEVYGDGLIYYTALFNAIHCSSSYFCISTIVLLYGLKNGKFTTKGQITFNAILIIVGVYSLLKSYVRTGWLMFFVGCIMLIDWKKINFSNLHRYILWFLVGICALLLFFLNNTDFRNRITEKNVWNQDKEVEIDGSGRFDYWKVSLTNYVKNDWYGLLFGKGLEGVKDDMERAIGYRIFSHNHFVDILAAYGLFGLILLVFYFISLYFFIKKYGRGSPYQNLAYIFWVLYFIFAFFQSEMYFWYAVMFSLCLVLMRSSVEECNM